MDLPGPGQYDYTNSGLFSPAKSSRSFMSKAPRIEKANKDRLMSPGPGAYEANKNVTKDKVPAASFGKTRRSEIVSKADA